MVSVAILFIGGCSAPDKGVSRGRLVVASDTLVGSMLESLLPQGEFEVYTILPSDQCPGHYDVKLSDIEKVETAELSVYFKDMPIGKRIMEAGRSGIALSESGENWMLPGNYIKGAGILAGELEEKFPEFSNDIARNFGKLEREVTVAGDALKNRLSEAGCEKAVAVVARMQKDQLEWMGFETICLYGRPESFSSRTVAECVTEAKKKGAVLVADNLQSGPDAGSGIAESLGIPHITLKNFPSEDGYIATIENNVNIVIESVR